MEGLMALAVLIVLGVPILLIVALISIAGLKGRVARLEEALAVLQEREASSAPSMESVSTSAHGVPPRAENGVPDGVPDAVPWELERFEGEQHPEAAEPEVLAPAALDVADKPLPQVDVEQRPRPPERPDPMVLAWRLLKRWFSSGNVPVKVGVLVLFAGVSALLKYASDQGLLRLPPALKLAGVALAALGALGFAWRKRESNRTFALNLQGGAIGVLLLVVFAAFKLFGLVPAGAAFALSLILIAGAGALAVLQNAMALAIFALLAGFLAPIWLSTGSGNHVALFSYYAMLNAAIVGIAWYRAWRLLNLLGFAFTFGIGIVWGALSYSPGKFASTEPFLLLFFLFYLLVPLLFARKRPPDRRDLIDGCLVFGTPLIAFSLQAVLLDGNRAAIALNALGLGGLYLILARWLRQYASYRVLMQVYALLAAAFATLAVPLGLSARVTASVYALEGAGLVWLGLRRERRLPQLSGAGLQMLAGLAFVVGLSKDMSAFAQPMGPSWAIANPVFMTGLLLALAGFACAYAYRTMSDKHAVAGSYYLWGMLWWLVIGCREIDLFLPASTHPDALLVFFALTGWLAAEVRGGAVSLLRWTAMGSVAVSVPLLLWQVSVHQQPFAGYGALAWLMYAFMTARIFRLQRGQQNALAAPMQFVWWLTWVFSLTLLTRWLLKDRALGDGWQVALLALPWIAWVALVQRCWAWMMQPLGDEFDHWRERILKTGFSLVGLWLCAALFRPGDANPLPWLPVLNPQDLVQLAALALLIQWKSGSERRMSSQWNTVVSVLGFVWLTMTVLHAVHHWGGKPWVGLVAMSGGGWGQETLLSTTLAQTSLTLTWSILGVLGWVLGSKRGSRMLWLMGAVLMGLVLAKLVVVDRQHLGNLLGIGSFIVYGLLCTVVGYLAPVPPAEEVRGDPKEATA